ncbi:related to putative snare protein syn [Phialocephala subalpina]|uniref:Related to putative snare protein syn n=1 Tax=Phialocephala subalpina TaxID=576137 RepID=A0A1L7WSP4_9HELO|nr:related to putative snare protein syn [Phialocephala subalpina]
MAQQYGYGGRSNPYDQRGIPSPQYGAPYSNQPTMGRDDYATQNVEMEPLTKNGSDEFNRQDPNAILNACREVDRGIDEIKETLKELGVFQSTLLNDASGNSTLYEQLESMNANTMALYRNLVGKVKNIKQKPESGSPRNAPQVGKVDRRLKETIRTYQQVDKDFRKKLEEQAVRQYRIVRPDATEKDIRDAIENPSHQVFAQALMQSNRQGQSKDVMDAVEQRSEAIKKIESQIIELAQLFEDMDNLVMQQEAAVVNIEQKGEEVVENMDKGTEQIGVAIQSARNARKWKWWCLGIVVLIIAIIVIVILIYKFVIQNNGTSKTKRFVLTDFANEKLSAAGHRVISGQAWSPTSGTSGKIVVPGAAWAGETGDNVARSVVRKMRTFQA